MVKSKFVFTNACNIRHELIATASLQDSHGKSSSSYLFARRGRGNILKFLFYVVNTRYLHEYCSTIDGKHLKKLKLDLDFTFRHRLNLELDLQSLFGLLCTAVLIGWNPPYSPPAPHLGSYTRALLDSQERRHLTPTFRTLPTPLAAAGGLYLCCCGRWYNGCHHGGRWYLLWVVVVKIATASSCT